MFVGLAAAVGAGQVRAQEPVPRAAGFEVQVYPAGQIGAVRLDVPLQRDLLLSAYAGYDRARRGDFGRHDDERGGGPGGGLGAALRFGRFLVGARADVWWLGIDWSDRNPVAVGTTDITVLQPTARLGYRAGLGGATLLELSLALGAEINVRTRGPAVGEGPILLLGGAILRRL
ncbi:MAG: hypothetical protein AB7S39_12345 [Gemmatimonadales bacterium]